MKLEKLEYTKRAMMLENSQKDLYYAYFLMATQIEAGDVKTACAFINGYRFGIAIDLLVVVMSLVKILVKNS